MKNNPLRRTSPTVQRIRAILKKFPDGHLFTAQDNAYDLIVGYKPSEEATEYRRCFMKFGFMGCSEQEIREVCDGLKESYG